MKYRWAKPGIQDDVKNGRHKWGVLVTCLVSGTNCHIHVIPLFFRGFGLYQNQQKTSLESFAARLG